MDSPLQSSSSKRVQPVTWKRFIDFLLPLFLILVYLFVQVAFLRPPALQGGDQLDYFSTARDLPEVSASHRHLRLGLVIPVRAAIGAFGYSEAAYYAVPFLSGVALALATYALGRMLFTKWVGFLAGALVVLNPYVLWESSHLLPDITSTALVTGGFALLIHASRQSDEEDHQIGRASMFFVAGLLLGWAYLAREFIVLIYPVALLIWILYKPRFRDVALTAGGALVMLAFEMTWGWLVYQNPLQRIVVLLGRTSSPTPEMQERLAQLASEGALQWQRPFAELATLLPRQLLGRDGGGLWVLLILVLGIAFLVSLMPKTRHKSLILTGVWAVVFIAVMTAIAVTSWPGGRQILRLHKIRYWFPVFPALVVGGLGAVTIGAQWARHKLRLPRYFVGVGITVLALLVGWTAYQGIGSIAHSGSFIRNGGGSEYFELREWLAADGEEFGTLWTDTNHGSAFNLVLPMYTKTFWGTSIWQGSIQSFNNADGYMESNAIDAPIILNRLSLSNLAEMPEYAMSPPASWTVAFLRGRSIVLVPGDPSNEQVLLSQAGSEGSVPWMLVPRRGSSFNEREPWTQGTLQLEDDDHIYLLDAGIAGFGAPESSLTVPSESHVSGSATFKSAGSGSIRILCLYFEPGEDRITVPAWTPASLIASSVSEELSTSFYCRTPSNGDTFTFRVGVELRGPLTVEAVRVEAIGAEQPSG